MHVNINVKLNLSSITERLNQACHKVCLLLISHFGYLVQRIDLPVTLCLSFTLSLRQTHTEAEWSIGSEG